MTLLFDEISRGEYVEIGGLVLATPAWECVDFSGLYDAPPVRGGDQVVPYHEGAIPSKRFLAPRRVVLPMIVYGDVDREGAEYADARLGLRANLDALKREVARPAQNTTDGTRLLRHVFGDGEVRQAPCHVLAPLQVGAFSPNSVRCTLDVSIPGAVLRSPDLQEAISGIVLDGHTGTVIVPNGGTADQFDMILELSGTATEVVISNLTWDPTGETRLTYLTSIVGGVLLDTSNWTAEDGAGDPLSTINVTRHGHQRWFPLAPGPNEISIEPTGGTAQLTVRHYPAWL